METGWILTWVSGSRLIPGLSCFHLSEDSKLPWFDCYFSWSSPAWVKCIFVQCRYTDAEYTFVQYLQKNSTFAALYVSRHHWASSESKDLAGTWDALLILYHKSLLPSIGTDIYFKFPLSFHLGQRTRHLLTNCAQTLHTSAQLLNGDITFMFKESVWSLQLLPAALCLSVIGTVTLFAPLILL